ncbi:MAG: hypothetical protein AB8H79_01680 [Myxococcota bacterium]
MERFQAERATLARLRPRLAERHEGEFAVLFGDRLVGVYHTSREAYRAGLRAAGVDHPFYLEQISRRAEPVFVAGVR